MSPNVKFWRSLLFIPQFAFHKAQQLGADCYIADVQDSVPMNIKEAARQGLIEACLDGTFQNQNLVVRINEWAEENEMKRDLETLVGLPDVLGFLLTMIETAQEVDRLHERVAEEERRKNRPVGSTRFMILVETPAAIFNLPAIAKAGAGRIIGMILGSGDLFRITRAEQLTNFTLDFPRNSVVLACRAVGIEPFDAPCTNIVDKRGLENSCLSAQQHGFTGKASIHADHLKTIRRIFTPSVRQVAQARRIMAAQAKGELNCLQQKTNWDNGPARTRLMDGMGKIDGKLVGPPHIKQASWVLEQAEALVPVAQPGIRGKTVKHRVNYRLRPGDEIPNPFEITITESLLGLWNMAFYSHDRMVTSKLFADRLFGLTEPHQMPVPFMMNLYLTVCMSDTHGALYHLGFRNAQQHHLICTGQTVSQRITVKSIRQTANGKNSVVTTRRDLIDCQTGAVLFSVDKLELFPNLHHDTQEIDTGFNLGNEQPGASFRATVLERFAREKALVPTRQKVLSLQTGDLILHSLARPIGVDTNLALSTWFKVTHPIHLDHHTYETGDNRGITVSGGLVQSMALAAAARDLYEIVYEELVQADNLAPLGPSDTLGAFSYVLDRKAVLGAIEHEEVLIRTFGVKNLSPAEECSDLEFPPELFSGGHLKPGEYNDLLEKAGAYWLEGKICTVATRKIVRLIPRAHPESAATVVGQEAGCLI